jgi:N-acetyl-1-D-myo-inositol-2-amino-2-deoxy-alpha-D-glucopyranoside deacetylase
VSRLLFVHAHPDDETLTCGVALAHHVARGDDVHVLTCTLGEEGEVIPPDLAHLEGHPDDLLGPYRRDELAEALRRLGVTGHLLGDGDRGGAPRYRDSGMVGSAAAARPEAFAAADPGAPDGPGALVADVVRRLRPDVVVTYDRFGGYEHPDHVQAHRATRAAMQRLDDARLPARVLEIVTPRSWARDDRDAVRATAPDRLVVRGHRLVPPEADAPFTPSVVPDADVSHAVVDLAARAVKNHALRAHATQVVVADEELYALSNLVAVRSSEREGFRLVDPRTWEPAPGGAPVSPAAAAGTARPGLLD